MSGFWGVAFLNWSAQAPIMLDSRWSRPDSVQAALEGIGIKKKIKKDQ